jgi:hypothetical protein
MNEENLDTAPNAEEEVALDATEEVEAEEAEESREELMARVAKAEELANNQKIRAEKAEKKAKSSPKVVVQKASTPISGDMSGSELYAFIDAKVPQEDIEDVREYAAMKDISIVEALKSNVVKTILSDKKEMRGTAAAANVGAAKRAKNQTSDESLLANASKGELPNSDEDLNRLIRARKATKK